MSLVEQICGNYPEGFKKLDISSDPNSYLQMILEATQLDNCLILRGIKFL